MGLVLPRLAAAGAAGGGRGTALALMETLADYGTVSYFAVQTFTTGIYRAWFSLGDRIAAATGGTAARFRRAAACAGARLARPGALPLTPPPQPADPWQGGACSKVGGIASRPCLPMPLTVGFLLPAGLLLRLALAEGWRRAVRRALRQLLSRNSFVLAGITAACAVLLALLLAYSARLEEPASARVNRLVGRGYAVPGSVIAVGVLIPVTRLITGSPACGWASFNFSNPGLLLTGGIAALVMLPRALPRRGAADGGRVSPRSRQAWTMRRRASAARRAKPCAGCACTLLRGSPFPPPACWCSSM